MNVIQPPQELGEVFDRSASSLRQSMWRMTEALVAWHMGKGRFDIASAREEMQAVCGGIAEFGNVLGRRRMLVVSRSVRSLKAAWRQRPLELSIPKVPFQNAIDDIYNREPKISNDAREIRALYRDRKAFAMVRSTEDILTARVQALITDAMRERLSTAEITEEILRTSQEEGHDFTWWYSENVFRTNVASAYSEGLRQMARDPDVREVVPAFRYSAVGDSDTRPGHAALDGLIAATDDGIWNIYMPPIFYNCRCSWELVDVFELEKMGLVASNGTVITQYPSTWAARETENLFVAA